MKIIKKIFTDAGVDVNGKLCAFYFTRTDYVTKNDYDGVYGVSGAERADHDRIYKNISHYKIIGKYDEESSTILSLTNESFVTDNVNFDKIVPIDVSEMQEYLLNLYT
jgi:hypothetical protein